MPNLEDNLLSAVRDCLFNIFLAIVHTFRFLKLLWNYWVTWRLGVSQGLNQLVNTFLPSSLPYVWTYSKRTPHENSACPPPPNITHNPSSSQPTSFITLAYNVICINHRIIRNIVNSWNFVNQNILRWKVVSPELNPYDLMLLPRWWWAVSFTQKPLFLYGKSPGENWIGGRVGTRVSLDAVKKRSITCIAGNRTPAVQKLFHHYADWSTPVPNNYVYYILLYLNRQLKLRIATF
jgi:hypothetical protein